MKKSMTKKEFLRGLAVGVVSLALIVGVDTVYTTLNKPKPVEGDADAEGTYTPGTYSASEFGFARPVLVDCANGSASATAMCCPVPIRQRHWKC